MLWHLYPASINQPIKQASNQTKPYLYYTPIHHKTSPRPHIATKPSKQNLTPTTKSFKPHTSTPEVPKQNYTLCQQHPNPSSPPSPASSVRLPPFSPHHHPTNPPPSLRILVHLHRRLERRRRNGHGPHAVAAPARERAQRAQRGGHGGRGAVSDATEGKWVFHSESVEEIQFGFCVYMFWGWSLGAVVLTWLHFFSCQLVAVNVTLVRTIALQFTCLWRVNAANSPTMKRRKRASCYQDKIPALKLYYLDQIARSDSDSVNDHSKPTQRERHPSDA